METKPKKNREWLDSGTALIARIKELADKNSPFMQWLVAQEKQSLAYLEEGGQFNQLYQVHLRALEGIRTAAASKNQDDLSIHALRLLVLDLPTMVYLRNNRARELREMVQRMLKIHLPEVVELPPVTKITFVPKEKNEAVTKNTKEVLSMGVYKYAH